MFYTLVIYILLLTLLVLEYVDGKMFCDNGLNEATARNYLRDMISGVMHLHSHVSYRNFPYTCMVSSIRGFIYS
jgi:hypothetical protein